MNFGLLPYLRKRFVVVQYCAWCKKVLGTVANHVSGESHGICLPCAQRFAQEAGFVFKPSTARMPHINGGHLCLYRVENQQAMLSAM